MKKLKIILRPGGLPNYHIKDPIRVRRDILMKLLETRQTTYSEMIKRINVLSIYNKNKNPDMSNRFIRDISFLQKYAAPIYSLTYLKNSAKKKK